MLAGVWLIYATFGMTTVSLAPLVPQITRDLAITATGMGLIFGSWQLVYIVASIPCGALLDRIGVRRGLLIGAAAVALSSLLRGLAVDLWTMIAAVGFFGIGGPIISSGAPKVVAQWFTGRERGFAMGVYFTGPATGAMLSLSLTNPVLLPLLGHDWRSVMWVWTAGTIAAGLIWLVIARSSTMRAHDEPPSQGTRPSQTSVVLELLALPSVRVLLAMSIAIFTFNHGLNNWLPEILREKGLSASAAGFWAAIPTLVGLAGSLTIPRFATPERRFRILIALCVSAFLASLLLRAAPGTPLIVGLVLQGIARSSLMTIAILALVEIPQIGERRAGVATGMFFSAAEIGGAGGPLVVGAIYSAAGNFAPGLTFLSGMMILLTLGAVYLAVLARRPAS